MKRKISDPLQFFKALYRACKQKQQHETNLQNKQQQLIQNLQEQHQQQQDLIRVLLLRNNNPQNSFNSQRESGVAGIPNESSTIPFQQNAS